VVAEGEDSPKRMMARVGVRDFSKLKNNYLLVYF